MKIAILTFYFFYVSSFCAFGQNDQDERSKKALQSIWLSYSAWQSSTCEFVQADSYIKKGNQITGQYLLKPSAKKHMTVKLKWEDDLIVGAKIDNDMDVHLTWQNNQVTSVKTPLLYEFDYTIKSEIEGKKVKLIKNMPSSKTSYSYEIIFDDKKIMTLTAYEGSGKPYVRGVKNFNYNAGNTSATLVKYKKGKPQKDKFIVTKQVCSCVETEPNQFELTTAHNSTETIKYNNNDQIIYRKSKTPSYTQEDQYFYQSDELYKKEQTRNVNGQFSEKVVQIIAVPQTINAKTPVYEKQIGMYKFSKNGELIYEARDGKYRKKENGAWSDWKSKTY